MKELMPHQQKACEFIESIGGCAGLFMAPGTGKTLTAIRSSKPPVLVVCRPDDFMTWEDELLGDGVDPSKIWIIDKGKDIPEPGMEWVLVSYGLVKKLMALLAGYGFVSVVWDESQNIKSMKAQRTKASVKLAKRVRYRITMTGSHMTNSIEDLFAHALVIDLGQTFGDNWFRFMQRYFNKVQYRWFLKKGAKETITNKMAKISIGLHEDDVLKLPPIRCMVKIVPMSGAQRRKYDMVMKEFEYEVNGKIVEVDLVISRLAKLRQIASGFLYDVDEEGNRKAVWFSSGKIEFLFRMLADEFEDRRKVVIWCAHTAEIFRIARLAREQGTEAVTFLGSDRKAKNKARKRFRDDPDVRLFVAQADSGVGMNELVVADTAIYFSNSTRVVSRQQSTRRIRRIGSEKHACITYVDLVSKGTVERKMLASIKRNMSLADLILEGLKKGKTLRNILADS